MGEAGILSEDGIKGEAAEVEGFFDRGGGMGVAGMEQGSIGEQSGAASFVRMWRQVLYGVVL